MAALRFAVRRLSRSPGFAASSVLLIGLAIGLTSAAFAIVHGVLLRKLPLSDPSRLVNINGLGSSGGELPLPLPMFVRLSGQFALSDGMFGWTTSVAQATIDGSPQLAEVLYVIGPYYKLLEGQPFRGRLFGEDEAAPVAIISDGFWQRSFNRDPGVLGRTVRVGRLSPVVIGITGRNYRDISNFERPDITIPLAALPADVANRYSVEVAALLKPGGSRRQAQTQLDTLWPRLVKETLPAGKTLEQWQHQVGSGARVSDGSRGRTWLPQELPGALLVVLGLSVLVMFVVCANVGGLMVVRSFAQRRDVAIRCALGAGLWQVVGDSFRESLLISLLAIIPGVFITIAGIRFGAALLPYQSLDFGIGLNVSVIAFMFFASVIIAFVASIFPSLSLLRVNTGELTKPGSGASRGRFGARKVLLVSQIGLTVVLLTLAGLFWQTLAELRRTDVGFDSVNLVLCMLEGRIPVKDTGPEYFHALEQRVRSIPGILDVGLMNNGPMQAAVDFPESVSVTGGSAASASRFCVWPGTLQMLGVTQVAGRDFTDGETGAVVLSHALAAQLFPGQSAIGHTISVASPRANSGNVDLPVIGVVGDAKLFSPHQLHTRTFFVPCTFQWASPQARYSMTLVIRASKVEQTLETAVRREVEVLGIQFSSRIVPLSDVMASSLTREEMLAKTSLLLGAVALLLSSIGLYALLALLLSTRMKEFGIRLALGGRVGALRRQVFAEAFGLTAMGGAGGIAVALMLRSLITVFLFNVSAYEVRTFAGVFVLVLVVGMSAACLPANRVKTINVTRLLRDQ